MMETTNKMARNEPRVDGTWEITVPHEEDWLAEDIEQARTEYHDQTEHGWCYMFEGLKQLLETGKMNDLDPMNKGACFIDEEYNPVSDVSGQCGRSHEPLHFHNRGFRDHEYRLVRPE